MAQPTGASRPALAIALAIALVAACSPAVVPTGTGPGTKPARGGSPKPGDPPAPDSRPPTGVPATSGPTGTPGPAGTAAPGTPAPPATTAAPPSQMPATATPAGKNAALRGLIQAKLLPLAKVGFSASRGELGLTGLLSDNGGALITDNGAGVISNNGSSLITDNGAGLAAGSGAGLISDRGGSYRLAQAAATPTPLPLPVIATQAEPGEKLVADRLFPDDVRLLTFHQDPPPTGTVFASREVYMRGGKASSETRRADLERWPSGRQKRVRNVQTEIIGGGRFYWRIGQVTEGTDQGVTTTNAFEPGSYMREVATGAEIVYDRFELDHVAGTGSFEVRYQAFGFTEKGTIARIVKNSLGQLLLHFWDPLSGFDGESATRDRDGKLLFTKRQKVVDGKLQRDFDLQDGVTMALVRENEDRFRGSLAVEGKQVAAVVQEIRPDGSTIFTVTFPDEPDLPLVIGYGLRDSQPGPRPTAGPQRVVLTLAGGAEAGYEDGAAGKARFSTPVDIARSRLSTSRFYIADNVNQRIRVLELGPPSVTISTLAGDGAKGHVDGPAASARFFGPVAIAAGPDDTLYVADAENHRIRKIVGARGASPEVSTLAGDGTAGTRDGVGTAARLNHPLGLVLDGSGKLYVSEAKGHTIRMIETQGPDAGKVTTLAGDGTAGLRDGDVAQARFNTPWGLAAGPDGGLYVADSFNRRIRKIKDGQVTTVAGSDDTSKTWMDGPALETRFNPPHHLVFAADGTLYFSTAADIYYLTPLGEVRSYAGVGAPGFRDGVNWQAAFEAAYGLVLRENGVLMVVDKHRVRAIVPPQPVK